MRNLFVYAFVITFLLISANSLLGEGAPVQKTPETANKDSQKEKEVLSPSKAAREEKAIQDARRQQLAEKEAALVSKEQELKKLSAKVESQVKALEDARKRLEDLQKAQAAVQKKQADEKTAKMLKLFKTMRGPQAGKIIDTLDEDTAIGLLDKMDVKSAAKLIPFLNQPRVLKWIADNLKGK